MNTEMEDYSDSEESDQESLDSVPTGVLQYNSKNLEVVTGYPKTISPLVMEPLRERCATCARTNELVISIPECLNTSFEVDKTNSSTPEHHFNEIVKSAKMPHAVACTKAGLMSFDTKRPYDEGHLYAGLIANNAKAYYNAEAYERGCIRSHAQINAHELSQTVDNVGGERCSNDEQCNCAVIGWHDADEHRPKPGYLLYTSTSSTLSHTSQCATQIQTAPVTVSHAPPHGTMNNCCDPKIGQSQNSVAIVNVRASPRETILENASATISRTTPCETMTNNASANVNLNSMSSTPERIELVTLPPPHIIPCATQLQPAFATRPEPPPRSFKLKNMSSSGCQNQDTDNTVPEPGQDNAKTSAVFKDNKTTSAPKGFNHLPQVKGEKSVGPVCYPSTPATTRFSVA